MTDRWGERLFKRFKSDGSVHPHLLRDAYILRECQLILSRAFAVPVKLHQGSVTALEMLSDGCVIEASMIDKDVAYLSFGLCRMSYHRPSGRLNVIFDHGKIPTDVFDMFTRHKGDANDWLGIFPGFHRRYWAWTKHTDVTYWENRECYLIFFWAHRGLLSRDIRRYIWQRFFSYVKH